MFKSGFIPKVALLIPTYNGNELFKTVLKGIEDQTIYISRKIIVDSGSSDDTIKYAKKNGFEVILINQNDFNHGNTRQMMVDLVPEVDICIFLTQDAIPATVDSFKNLISVFDKPEVALAYGRQLPHKNAKPLEIHARNFNYPPKSEIRSFSDKDTMGFKVFFCSNSFAAYRRKTLESLGGFQKDSIMGEDAILGAKLLMKGFKLAYVSEACVFHSHSYTYKEEFRRYFDTRVFHEQNKWLIEIFGKPTGEGIKFVKSEISYVLKNNLTMILRVIFSTAAKFLGYRVGKYYKKLSFYWLRKFSMHSFYWK